MDAARPLAVTEDPHDVYSHPLISWSGIFAGVAVALAVGLVLTFLGVAIGASAISPFQSARDQAPAWTIGGGLWVAFSNLVALQLGAFIAARTARWPDHYYGMLQGVVVWAVCLVLVAATLGGVGAMFADTMRAPHGLQAAADVAQTATGRESGAPSQLSPDEAEALKQATALTAWWAFATTLLALVGAIAGGRLGGEHPSHWTSRERIRPVTMADPIAPANLEARR